MRRDRGLHRNRRRRHRGGLSGALTGNEVFVGTFRIEDPATYARTAFVEALRRNGITMTAPTIAPNPAALLPAADSYSDQNRVASFVAPPYLQEAQLILKVSLNLGANSH